MYVSKALGPWAMLLGSQPRVLSLKGQRMESSLGRPEKGPWRKEVRPGPRKWPHLERHCRKGAEHELRFRNGNTPDAFGGLTGDSQTPGERGTPQSRGRGSVSGEVQRGPGHGPWGSEEVLRSSGEGQVRAAANRSPNKTLSVEWSRGCPPPGCWADKQLLPLFEGLIHARYRVKDSQCVASSVPTTALMSVRVFICLCLPDNKTKIL